MSSTNANSPEQQFIIDQVDRLRKGMGEDNKSVASLISAGLSDLKGALGGSGGGSSGLADLKEALATGLNTLSASMVTMASVQSDVLTQLKNGLDVRDVTPGPPPAPPAPPPPDPPDPEPDPAPPPLPPGLLNSLRGIDDRLDKILDAAENLGDSLKGKLVDLAATLGSLAAIQKNIADSLQLTMSSVNRKGYSDLNGGSVLSRGIDDFKGGMNPLERRESFDGQGRGTISHVEGTNNSLGAKAFAMTASGRIAKTALKYGQQVDDLRASANSLLGSMDLNIKEVNQAVEDVAVFSKVFGKSVGDITDIYVNSAKQFGETTDVIYRDMSRTAKYQDKVLEQTDLTRDMFLQNLEDVNEAVSRQNTSLEKQRKLYSGLVISLSKMGYHGEKAAKAAAAIAKDMLSTDGRDEGTLKEVSVNIMKQASAEIAKAGLTSKEDIQAMLDKRVLAQGGENVDPVTGKLTETAEANNRTLAGLLSEYQKGATAIPLVAAKQITDLLGTNGQLQSSLGVDVGNQVAMMMDKKLAMMPRADMKQVYLEAQGYSPDVINQVAYGGKTMTELANASTEIGDISDKDVAENMDEKKSAIFQESVISATTDISGTLSKILDCITGVPTLVLASLALLAFFKGKGLGKMAGKVINRVRGGGPPIPPGGGPPVPPGGGGGIGGKLLKGGSAVVGGVISGGLAYSDKSDELEDREDLTDEQKDVQAASTGIGAGAGAGIGFWAGAQMGATAGGAGGALVGGVGAVPGAIIGGLVGGIIGSLGGEWIGTMAGEKIGETISDQMDGVDPDTLTDAEPDDIGDIAQLTGETAYSSIKTNNAAGSTASSVPSPLMLQQQQQQQTLDPADIIGNGMISPVTGDLIIKNGGKAIYEYIKKQDEQKNTLAYGTN